ncbi:MAG TPA: hypothetical protein VGG74_14275 [Kofleriaceae bacterium]|jgi:hypothetical protein
MLLAIGCVKNGADGMVILENDAPSGTACTFSGQTGQPTFSSGQIFAGSTNAYVLTPLIESRIEAGSGLEVDRSILLQGANVTLSASGVSLPTSSFSTPVAGSIPPGGTVNVSFPIIPVTDLQAFDISGSTQGLITATVQIYGTEGGGTVDSEPFTYGVTVCPTGAPCVVQNNPVPSCTGFVSSGAGGNPCNAFQDGTVDCCKSGSDYVCPGVATM